MQARFEKSLVIFPGSLGDFVCFLPALESLARGSQVDLFAREEYRELLLRSVRTRSLDCPEISRLFVRGAEVDENLKGFFGSYAGIYSWMASGQPDFVANLFSLSNGKLRIFPFRPSAARVHLTDYYLACVGEEPRSEISANIFLRDDALQWGSRYWQEHELAAKKVLALHPGSGAKQKNWPGEYFTEVCDWWKRKFGGQVLIILGPAEAERGKLELFCGRGSVVECESLGRVASLLSRCDFYLGNDSGVTHLAAALGVRTAALFGPTDPVQWAPRGKKVMVISQNVECSPCSDRIMKRCPHRMCLTEMNPGKVIGSMAALLDDDRWYSAGLLDKVGCGD